MTPMYRNALALSVLALASAPAFAQTSDSSWTGFYAGGHVGLSKPTDDDDSRIKFDTNLDGNYNDTVRTGTGADAFSPGFCDSSAAAARPASGCRFDKGGAEYGARVGYDWQAGSFVYGLVAEYAKGDVRDAVSGFSTTPAFYTMTRDLDSTASLRARLGYAFGENSDYLVYVTAGGVQAKLDHSFRSSNTANAFTGSGDDKANGYQAGVGIERKVAEHFSVGLEYMYSRVKDDDYTVRTSKGTAPATNPFLLVDPNGTDFRRSDEDFEFSNLRLTATYRF